MKQNTRAWNLFCLLTALSLFFAVMGEARLTQSAKSMSGKSRHILTAVTRRPDLAFFWKLSRSHSDVSEQQKLQIHKEFRRMFLQTIAAEQEALGKDAGRSASTQRIGQILAEHYNTIHHIFTPEQRRKHRTHKHADRMSGKFFAALEGPRNAQSGRTRATVSSAEERVPSGAMPQFSRRLLARISPADASKHDLHQLQILRL